MYNHASPWASRFEVPAHDEFAVWQSFLPALATPKHFSFWKAGALAGWAWAAPKAAKPMAAARVSSVVFMVGLPWFGLLGGSAGRVPPGHNRTIPGQRRRRKFRFPMGSRPAGYETLLGYAGFGTEAGGTR